MLSEDKLFATLDPTTRALTLDDGYDPAYRLLLDLSVNRRTEAAFEEPPGGSEICRLYYSCGRLSESSQYSRWRLFMITSQELGVQGKKTITLFNKVDVVSAIRQATAWQTILKVWTKQGVWRI